MLSDLEIAQRAEIKPVAEIAEKLGLLPDELEFHGKYKAKIELKVMDRVKSRPQGKYIDVTAITPTPLGEGKTVTTIGLSQSLARIGKNVLTCIRQPSLGPVFGIKGGAAGGGYSQVIPMEDFNLHLTGDVHAVGLAHNLLSAFVDNSLFHKNPLQINPYTITWPRVLDVSDRALRKIVIGLGGKEDGVPRESSFDITVASEVMAILALTTDLFDLRKRLGRIVVATDRSGKAITAEALKAAGAMAVLLKDAIKPTLMQTLEHTPCFVHAGPFANIAHGNSSVIADLIGIRMAEYLVTESGFGADCGAEKFFDIKCRVSGLKPDVVVIVCSVRALKMHSGKFKIVPGKSLPEKLLKEDPDTVIEGAANLAKHIENVKLYGVPTIVAINRFPTDFDSEIKAVHKVAEGAGAEAACESNVWAKGGEGGRELAEAVVSAAGKPKNFQFLYPLEASIKEKIEAVATRIYGAARVEYSPLAEEKIARYTELGYANLPVCMAKTHLSLSHDPKVKGRPTGFTLPIRDIRLAAGAGFLYPLCGEMRTMPGLPTEPAGTKIDIDKNGAVVGLF